VEDKSGAPAIERSEHEADETRNEKERRECARGKKGEVISLEKALEHHALIPGGSELVEAKVIDDLRVVVVAWRGGKGASVAIP